MEMGCLVSASFLSRNTVTQYWSVFRLIAVIVGYCGCGWFSINNYTKTGPLCCWKSGQALVWDATLPLQHTSICIPEKQAQVQVSQNIVSQKRKGD